MTDEPKERMLAYFAYEHLPPRLQFVSEPFHRLAHSLVDNLPANPERTVCLRKLLEAKDCAVRAQLENVPGAEPDTVGWGDKREKV